MADSLLNASTDTSSDFSDDLSLKHQKNQQDNGSDEFEMAFSEKENSKQLKPSKVQQNAEKQSKFVEIQIDDPQHTDNDDDKDGIAIQTEILSDYLKPTNILSKYQNGPPANHMDNNHTEAPAQEQEEEEKEWPTSKEEATFNHVTYRFNEEYQDETVESENEEEKSDFDPIGFEDLYPYLMEQANEEIDWEDITIEDFRNISWLDYLRMFIFGRCAVALKTQQLNDERDAIFKMAKLKFDVGDIVHNRMLQTLWMKLTDDTRQCDKTGSHWQQIGFQGNEPSTDIRGCGLFGVLQLIYMIEKYEYITSKIYLLSINGHQHFPLTIVSFTISGIVIKLLRSCLIYNEINARKSVSDAVHEIYVALFYEFYLKWKNKSRTIINFDEAQKELEKEAFANWNVLMRQLMQRTNEITTEQNSQKQHLIPDYTENAFGTSKNAKNCDKINSKRHNRYTL